MARGAQADGEAVAPVSQQFLLDLGSNEIAGGRSKKEVARKASVRQNNGQVSLLAVADHLRQQTAHLEVRLGRIETLLAEIRAAQAAEAPTKDYYSTAEAAKLLGKRPYTVREWCRLGRVRGEKALSGRGLDEEWRISHAELRRIQNEGLLAVTPESRVQRAPRLTRQPE
jgi:hypothetical protein